MFETIKKTGDCYFFPIDRECGAEWTRREFTPVHTGVRTLVDEPFEGLAEIEEPVDW